MQKQNGGSGGEKKQKGKGRWGRWANGQEVEDEETGDVFRCQTMLAEYKTEERPDERAERRKAHEGTGERQRGVEGVRLDGLFRGGGYSLSIRPWPCGHLQACRVFTRTKVRNIGSPSKTFLVRGDTCSTSAKFSGFWIPPLSTFGPDLQYRIHATFLSLSDFPLPLSRCGRHISITLNELLNVNHY